MKRLITIVTSFIMVLTVFVPATYAADSVEFENIQSLVTRMDNENPNKLIYDDNSMLFNESNENKKTVNSSIPSKYSIEDKLPAVRDQEDTGTCWSFAALASLESDLISKGLATDKINFSEYHLAYFSYNGSNTATKSKYAGKDSFRTTNPYNDGGNSFIAGATLARWYGAVYQKLASNPLSLNGNLRTESEVHLEDVNWLPVPKNKSQRNVIKRYIMNNGAIVMVYSHHDYCYNEDTYIHNCQHYDTSGMHDVTVVGWDDNKNAWRIRNSWGSGWGDDGYFYISYNDTTIVDMYGFKAGNANKTYNYIYQYDGIGFGDDFLISTSNILSANRFNARSDLNLKAISTYTPATDCEVYVRVYINPNTKSPVSGKQVFNKTYNVDNAGYHTLEINKDIYIPEGATYSIVVRTSFNNDKKYYLIPNEICAIDYDFSKIDYSAKQSYVYVDGKWNDVTKLSNINFDGYRFDVGNALVKGFGKKTGTEAQRIKVPYSSYKKVNGTKSFNINAERTQGTGTLYYKSSNTNVATVNNSGQVTVKNPGKTTITVYAAPTAKYSSTKKTVNVTVTPMKAVLKSVTSPEKGKIKITWRKFPKASGYVVQAALDKEFSKDKRSILLSGSSKVTRSFTGMKSGKTYYARVRAYKTVNGEKIYGPYSTIKTVKIK